MTALTVTLTFTLMLASLVAKGAAASYTCDVRVSIGPDITVIELDRANATIHRCDQSNFKAVFTVAGITLVTDQVGDIDLASEQVRRKFHELALGGNDLPPFDSYIKFVDAKVDIQSRLKWIVSDKTWPTKCVHSLDGDILLLFNVRYPLIKHLIFLPGVMATVSYDCSSIFIAPTHKLDLRALKSAF